jgi:hypothetical protein
MYNNTKDNMFYFNQTNDIYRKVFDPLTKQYVFNKSNYTDLLNRLNTDGNILMFKICKETELVGCSG